MLILRYLVLFAIAALGVTLLVDGLVNSSYRLQGWIGIALFALSLAAAVFVIAAVRTGRLPLRAWFVLPPLLGGGAAAAAHNNAIPALVNLGPGLIGLGTALAAYAGLQIWADRWGGRDWWGLAVVALVIVTGSVIGRIVWFLR